jgi:hypothetical protein
MSPNQLDPDALRELVAQASTPFERLNGAFVSCPGPAHDPLLEARPAQWRQVAAAGDGAQFARRLAWEGLDETAARRALGPVRLKAECPLPRWAATLDHLLQDLPPPALPGGDGESARPRFLHPEERLPFEELLAPVVATASRQPIPRLRYLSQDLHQRTACPSHPFLPLPSANETLFGESVSHFREY